MVGIVIVSHSAKLAEGLRDLAAQVASDAAGIVAAGGMEDGSIGTDAARIAEAIAAADDGSGVVVLPDLGSGVMSAEMALEFVDDGVDARLVDAPLVEGTIAAAVEAGCGSDIDEVVRTAEDAWNARKL